MVERLGELAWYDPVTWQLRDQTPVPASAGINHADFSQDGHTAVFSCEFAGRVAVVDVATHRLLRTIDMPVRQTHMGPQDVRLAPDGSGFYVADCDAGGVWVLDGAATSSGSSPRVPAPTRCSCPATRQGYSSRTGWAARSRCWTRSRARRSRCGGCPGRQPRHGQHHRRRPSVVGVRAL